MLRLASLVYSFVGTTMAGILIIAALVMGQDTWKPIVVAAAIGFALAVPASVFIARQMMKLKR